MRSRLSPLFGWTRYLLVWPAVSAYRRRARRSLRWRLAGYNLATLVTGLATAFILVGLLAAAGATARDWAEEEPASDARAVADFLVNGGFVLPGVPLDEASFRAVPALATGQLVLYRDAGNNQFDVRPKRYLEGVRRVVVFAPELPANYWPRDPAEDGVIARAQAGSRDLRANSALREFDGSRGVGAYPLTDGSGVQRGIVLVDKSEIQTPRGWRPILRAEVRPVVATVWVGSVIAALPGLVVAALLAVAAARSVGGRIRELSLTAGQLAGGDLSSRADVRGEDEVASLGESFNSMAERLETAMNSLSVEREKALSLLDANRQLVANVSHELRTPVALVRGQVEALADETPESERPAMALREIDRLEALVTDLFALASAEADGANTEMVVFDAVVCVRDAAAPLVDLARREAGVTLALDVPDSRMAVRGDPRRLGAVVQNLLRNATRHTPEGGIVLIRAGRDGHTVAIEVRDTGPGIAPDDLPHVFDRFYRGDASRGRESGGAGLGLAIAREFIEAMHGSIAVESASGEGATFTVRLPLASTAS